MQTWRRGFATSVARLNHSSITRSRPSILRCAQILQASRKDGPCSLEEQEIKVNGFIRSVRKQKRFAFAEISDGSTVEPLQAILKPAQASDLSTGTAVQVSGIWKACPPGKEQSHELQTTDVTVVGASDSETFPIQKKYHSPDFLRQIPHLRIRTPFNSLLSRFRSECLFQLGIVFHSLPDGAFTQVQPPIITSSDCEGAGETFTLVPRGDAAGSSADTEHFFRAPKYLTVSSQLHLEAYAAELGNVWTLAPVFRAEKSDTPRHLSEFYMLEAEVNFMSDLDALTGLVEHMLRDLTRRLYHTTVGQEILSAKRSGESGKEDGVEESGLSLQQRWSDLMDGPKWHRVTYTQAVEMLQRAVAEDGASFEHAPTWTGGLQLEHEKYIVEVLHQGRPVFVTDYPKFIKPFYMAPSGSSGTTEGSDKFGETVACFDLLLPEISEVAGGSLREHRLPEIIQNMRDHGLIKPRVLSDSEAAAPSEPLYPHLSPTEDLSHLQWYADLRRWGSAPHGGFGLGFDRFLGYLAGVSSVRDVVSFPRYFGRADC
ncbi:Nucleic acid-binding OB-fold-containing protein [Penicillium alfredii]|uniref:Nucleic acid-binding OB-fold-containing protein n=1 Tax=Penicillium alfredii TaxID=1506179 RepID=A0A9W9F8L3_9EURO|nr:Nucleic acid-binding OB-fold-containing protein [Penicillium alfredii]KAJ5095588.1 Nucleic acid-binding OB-fold-containing protein [Penicillium alfredii]